MIEYMGVGYFEKLAEPIHPSGRQLWAPLTIDNVSAISPVHRVMAVWGRTVDASKVDGSSEHTILFVFGEKLGKERTR